MIRLLTRSDAQQYRNLRLQALMTDPEMFLSTYDTEHKRPALSFEYEVSDAIAHPGFGYYGVFDGDQLVAFCQVAPSYLAKQPHVAFLYNLYVDPNHRGKGIATNLLTEILTMLKTDGMEVVIISHVGKNSSAHQLYLQLGFIQTGLRPKTVKWDNVYDDEVEMVLHLQSSLATSKENN
jgi:RimJ/RimL family protein N-acetyltransferase